MSMNYYPVAGYVVPFNKILKVLDPNNDKYVDLDVDQFSIMEDEELSDLRSDIDKLLGSNWGVFSLDDDVSSYSYNLEHGVLYITIPNESLYVMKKTDLHRNLESIGLIPEEFYATVLG